MLPSKRKTVLKMMNYQNGLLIDAEPVPLKWMVAQKRVGSPVESRESKHQKVEQDIASCNSGEPHREKLLRAARPWREETGRPIG